MCSERCLAGLIAAFVANRLARPLRELSRSAVAIGRGDRPVIPHLRGGAEVEQLSAAMRTMQAAVAHREDDLRLLASSSERLTESLEYTETLRTLRRSQCGLRRLGHRDMSRRQSNPRASRTPIPKPRR